MSAQPLDKQTIRRAAQKFFEKEGWAFIALKGDLGCTVHDDDFFVLLDSLMTYISDDIYWQNYQGGKSHVQANLRLVK